MTGWWVALGVAWLLGIPAAIFIGRAAAQRDQQVPTDSPLEELMPERLASPTNRWAAIGDHIGVLLDQADLSITVRYRGTAEAPTFGLAHLARVLDEAGLIDDLPLTKEQHL